MRETPVLSPAGAGLTVERLHVAPSLSWADVVPGMDASAIRADLCVRVCGKEIRFPQVNYGFCFESASAVSLKAILQGLVALDEGMPNAWRESHGGMRTHLFQLSEEPGDRFELFIFDDEHLYFAYHTNHGGALSVDLLVTVGGMLEAEERATEELIAILDRQTPGAAGSEERSRYLGQWEHLKLSARSLESRLLGLLPPFEEPLF